MWQLADIVLRSAAVTLLLFLSIVFSTKYRPSWQSRFATLFAVGIACHLICPYFAADPSPGPFSYLLFVGCIGVPAFFWAFSRSIFDDGFRPRWPEALVLLIVEVAGFARLNLAHDAAQGPASTGSLVAMLLQVPALIVVMVSLMLAWSGRSVDLLEERRRFRRLFVALAGIYIAVVVAVEMYLRGEPAPVLSAVHAALALAVTIAVALYVLRPASGLLWEKSAETGEKPTPVDLQIAERLRNTMEQERFYAREGVTILSLAQALGAQEYRLRRVINGQLGFRNFNEFVNRYRIKDACDKLSDPLLAHLPILTIALDLGFRSIGPFNRAFKEATGQTPSDFRRAQLSGASATAPPQISR